MDRWRDKVMDRSWIDRQMERWMYRKKEIDIYQIYRSTIKYINQDNYQIKCGMIFVIYQGFDFTIKYYPILNRFMSYAIKI